MVFAQRYRGSTIAWNAMVQNIYPLRSLAAKYAPIVTRFGASNPVEQIQVGDRKIAVKRFLKSELPIRSWHNDATDLVLKLKPKEAVLIGKTDKEPTEDHRFWNCIKAAPAECEPKIVSAVIVPHEHFSRTHMKIFRDEKGTFWVQDMDSENGTRLQHDLLPKGGKAVIHPGSWVSDKKYVFYLRIPR